MFFSSFWKQTSKTRTRFSKVKGVFPSLVPALMLFMDFCGRRCGHQQICGTEGKNRFVGKRKPLRLGQTRLMEKGRDGLGRDHSSGATYMVGRKCTCYVYKASKLLVGQKIYNLNTMGSSLKNKGSAPHDTAWGERQL